MNSSTITSMFGTDLSSFKTTDIEVICSNVGFLYYLEENNDKIICLFCNSSNSATFK